MTGATWLDHHRRQSGWDVAQRDYVTVQSDVLPTELWGTAMLQGRNNERPSAHRRGDFRRPTSFLRPVTLPRLLFVAPVLFVVGASQIATWAADSSTRTPPTPAAEQQTTYTTPSGRPMKIAGGGRVIQELFT